MAEPSDNPLHSSEDSPLLQARNLYKSYRKRGGKEIVNAVSGVSLKIDRGEILGLLGPNGAGKTTTIKMLCGLVLPDAGSVTIGGADLHRQRSAALRRVAAVLEGNRNLYWRLTARENLLYFAGNRGLGGPALRRTADELLERFGLADKRGELVSNLSRGMQQKLAIAVALLADTELILLDEPTLGLDVEAGYEVRALLKEASQEGRTIIISTHDMPVVQALCERTVIISAGRVVADERVSALMRLFETRAYAVTLAAPLSDRQLESLRALFAGLELQGNRRHFTTNLSHGNEIYRLTRALEEVGADIETFGRTTVDFEQVFRRVVNASGSSRAPGQEDGQRENARREPARQVTERERTSVN